MARPSAWRVLVFALICIPVPVAVWAAHNFGRAALGGIVGGVLVAIVSAMMLGAVLLIVGLLLLKPTPPKPPARSTGPRW